MSLADLRREYADQPLDKSDLHHDPVQQFRHWFDQAVTAGVPEPNAMTLATATSTGRPAARIVLLKLIDERGLVFFSNYQSRKGRELATNPHAALLFFWPELERQVRIEGTVNLTTPTESDEYFRSRPYDSRLGAWASAQSEVVTERSVLEQSMQRFRSEFSAGDVPRPPHWGGYRLVPTTLEFWQGRPNRLHDRLVYFLDETAWRIRRLAP